MSLCSKAEALHRKNVADQKAQRAKGRSEQQPLAVTPDVVHYAKALRAKALTADGIPERLRAAVQEYLMTHRVKEK